MGRHSNMYNFPAGFNIEGDEAIDSRLLVDSIDDIYLPSTWEGVGIYNGMPVTTKTGEFRILIDKNNVSSEESWVEIKGGGSGTIENDIKDKNGNIIIPKGKTVTEAFSMMLSILDNIDEKDNDISIIRENNKLYLKINGISNE